LKGLRPFTPGCQENGALFHSAEHATRHGGQLTTTVEVLRATSLTNAAAASTA
jgi:hypothetical protein